MAVLDPVLHSPAVRHRSSLLYTSIIAVTSKITRPAIYPPVLALANKMLGQAVEYGHCDIETVQSFILLTHWKKPDDATSWRRVGYAIRMGLELRLNVRGARPLPIDEREAREVLNKERVWLVLLIADYQ